MEDIMRETFLVFVRLSTHKESSEFFMSPEFYGRLVYDHYVLDVPRLMDICVVFHPHNPVLVEKMVANIVSQCPKVSQLKDISHSR